MSKYGNCERGRYSGRGGWGGGSGVTGRGIKIRGRRRHCARSCPRGFVYEVAASSPITPRFATTRVALLAAYRVVHRLNERFFGSQISVLTYKQTYRLIFLSWEIILSVDKIGFKAIRILDLAKLVLRTRIIWWYIDFKRRMSFYQLIKLILRTKIFNSDI
jgi:hypothetical protein